MTLICTKPLQARALEEGNKQQWEFWEKVLKDKTYGGLGKTELEAIALVNFFEGRYTMANEFNRILKEDTENG